MASTVLTADVIAKRALVRLENELGIIGLFHRAYEDEYSQKVNGYKKGDTISIRRPVDYTIRDGAVMDVQESIEGKVNLTINQQKGVDLSFTSKDMTLDIDQFDERFLKSAVSTIVNAVAYDCMESFLWKVYNYVGTPNAAVDSFDDFMRVPERMNHMAIPMTGRNAILNPTDHARMVANLSGLYIERDARGAYREGVLGSLAGFESVMMSQVVPAQTYGTADNTTPLTDGSSQEVSYDTVKDTWTQTLATDGWDSQVTLYKGQVFTIDGVYMVNPRTKQSTGILQQFTVMEDVTTASSSANNTDFTISPPIITSGPHQTVTYAGNFNDRTITIIGPASGTGATYRQNVAFSRGAFALAMVPMEMPQGVVNGARETYKGLSIRLIPVYDGINDVEKWRLDVLYGRECIDPRLAVRFSGQ